MAGVAKGNLRQAIVDTEILGYKIPKGAEIFMNYHINRTPVPVDESNRTAGSKAAAVKHGDGLQESAGRDIGTFEPRRWLVKDDKTGEDVFSAYALPNISFGGGYRGCSGTSFSNQQLDIPILRNANRCCLRSGRKLAYMEFRIVVTLLILNLEFLELPEDFKSMSATEKIFRRPDKPFARLREL